jgi:hypothetical protein
MPSAVLKPDVAVYADEVSTKGTTSDTPTTSDSDSDDASKSCSCSDASTLLFSIRAEAESEASTRSSGKIVFVRSIDRDELNCCVDPRSEGRQFLPPHIVYLLTPRKNWSHANMGHAARTAAGDTRAQKVSL